MRIHRFIKNINIKLGDLRIADKELYNQLNKVLKLKVGEKIIICDGQMHEGSAEISGYDKNAVDLSIINVSKNSAEPKINTTLYCAVLKNDNFEFVAQKATELGAKKIVPIITARTVKLSLKYERLEKIIKEAAEQSGRGMVPALSQAIAFEEAVRGVLGDHRTNLFFHLSGEILTADNRLSIKENVCVWIGPEGGWDEEEIGLIKNIPNFKIIKLANLTLRAETAAIIGLYEAINSINCR